MIFIGINRVGGGFDHILHLKKIKSFSKTVWPKKMYGITHKQAHWHVGESQFCKMCHWTNLGTNKGIKVWCRFIYVFEQLLRMLLKTTKLNI